MGTSVSAAKVLSLQPVGFEITLMMPTRFDQVSALWKPRSFFDSPCVSRGCPTAVHFLLSVSIAYSIPPYPPPLPSFHLYSFRTWPGLPSLWILRRMPPVPVISSALMPLDTTTVCWKARLWAQTEQRTSHTPAPKGCKGSPSRLHSKTPFRRLYFDDYISTIVLLQCSTEQIWCKFCLYLVLWCSFCSGFFVPNPRALGLCFSPFLSAL